MTERKTIESMKQQFITKSFRPASLERIDQINGIIEDYQRQGYSLTLRQLYYQLVSRDLIPNKQNEYQKLSALVTDARRAGLIDWNAIEDRTRYLRDYEKLSGISEAVKQAAYQYSIDLWKGQPCYIEVWVEKDALIDIVAKACSVYRTPFFSCRGFMSDSEIYKAGRRMREIYLSGKEIIFLHLGDHDPSGCEMSKDVLRRVEMFGELSNKIDFQRIALNMDQIEEFNPPPNPAKETDTRAKAYIEKYGPISWELDALEPAILTRLIQTTIEKYLDIDLFNERLRIEDAETQELLKLADSIGA